MLDPFDIRLLNLLQRDASRTAEALATDVPLSPSAIARRLRALRANGWIDKVIALVSPRLKRNRIRAAVLIRFADHADLAGKASFEQTLNEMPEVQFAFELAGQEDFLCLFDCENLEELNGILDALLARRSAVTRYETLFIRREVKFAPYAELAPPA